MKYTPNPITIDRKMLSEALSVLLEDLAKNVHENWAAGRLRDGWSLGHVRNDEMKEHPSLIPYEELPESEKEYDIATVLATLGFLKEYNLLNIKDL
jgi:RyR domain.